MSHQRTMSPVSRTVIAAAPMGIPGMNPLVPGSGGCAAPDAQLAVAAAGSSQDAPGAEQAGSRGWWFAAAPLRSSTRAVLGRRGWDPPCSAMCTVWGVWIQETPKNTPCPGSTAAPAHKGTSRGSREHGTAAVQGDWGVGCPQPGTPLKGSEPAPPAPWQQTPGETRVGAAPIPSSSSRWLWVAVPAPWDGASQPCPPRLSPCWLTQAGGWQPAPPSQMAWAASTGGPVPRQIGAGCLQSAWEGLHPCHGLGTRAKPGSSHGAGVQSGGGHQGQLKVPVLLCLVLDLAKILNQGCG